GRCRGGTWTSRASPPLCRSRRARHRPSAGRPRPGRVRSSASLPGCIQQTRRAVGQFVCTFVYMSRLLVPVVLAASLAAGPVALGADGKSTLEQTIGGGDPAEGFQLLQAGPGEPYAVRAEIASPDPGRQNRRVSLIYFGQISDFQLADEESPARVEFLDPDPSGTARAAWRPQEALQVYEIDQSIRAMNQLTTSPVEQGDGTHAQMANAVLTGDLADNMQRNETE